MAEKNEVTVFRNKATGKVWAVNPGTPAHDRMRKGVAIGEYEPAKADKPKRAPAKKQAAPSSTDGE